MKSNARRGCGCLIIIALVGAVIANMGGRRETNGAATLMPTAGQDLRGALEVAFAEVEGVRRVDLVYQQDDYVNAELTVELGYVDEATAEALATTARRVMVSAGLEMAFLLSDGEQAVDYIWSNRTDSWQATELTLP